MGNGSSRIVHGFGQSLQQPLPEFFDVRMMFEEWKKQNLEPMRVDVPTVAGLNVEIGLLLAMLDDGTKEWREELGEVEQEAVVWQPIPNGHSIGTVILHIADVEAFWLHEVAAGEKLPVEQAALLMGEDMDQYVGKWPVPPQQPLAWYWAQHGAIRARTREIIAHINDPEHLGRRYSISRGRETEFTLRWLLHHVLTHEAYHGGQAVLLAQQYKRWQRE